MTDSASTISKEICDRFLPLSSIPNDMRDELLQHAMTASFDVYSNITKHSGKKVLYHYLIDGYADVRHSFDKRTNISSSDPKCAQPLEELIKIIRERKKSSPDKSYTNKLLNDKKLSLDKVKEEINELIESVEQNTNKIHEAADVIYHLLVYLEANGIKIEDVMDELQKRKNELRR